MDREFTICVENIAKILDKSANLDKFKLVCCRVTTQSLLFNEEESAAIRGSSSVFHMFEQLRGHWRWYSHHLLSTLINLTESQAALQELNQFENNIDYGKKLNDTEFSSYFQSMHEPLPPGYTIMRAIVDKKYSELTLKDCKQLDEDLTREFGSIALRPPIYKGSNFTEVTWYIPAEAVSGLLSKLYQAKEIFKLLLISFFEIDDVVILNKKVLGSLDVCMCAHNYTHVKSY